MEIHGVGDGDTLRWRDGDIYLYTHTNIYIYI